MTGPIQIRRRVDFTDAYPYDGTNAAQIVAWAKGHAYIADNGELIIITNRGDVAADPQDVVIRSLAGHYYPCPPDDYARGWAPF